MSMITTVKRFQGQLQPRARSRDVLQRLKRGQGSAWTATEEWSLGSGAEHLIDEPVLHSDVTLCHPTNLALPNLVHCFVTLNRPPRTTELPKVLLGRIRFLMAR